MASTLLAALRRAAPSSMALISPKQHISLTYGELDNQIRRVARGLRELQVRQHDVVVSDVPNTAENIILQLALSHLGASFASAKDAKSLKEKVAGDVVCAVASNGDSWLANRETLPTSVKNTVILDTSPGYDKLGHLSFAEIAKSAADVEEQATLPDALFASYNGAALSQRNAVALGQDAAAALSSTPSDRSCVSITLCHAFGFGSGVGSALLSGGAVVLPAAGGIRGCGDPKQRAAVTAEVLAGTGATLLFADTHVLKQLADFGAGGRGGAAEKGGSLGLRGGIVKVGSGTDIFDDGSGMALAGARLLAMGARSP